LAGILPHFCHSDEGGTFAEKKKNRQLPKIPPASGRVAGAMTKTLSQTTFQGVGGILGGINQY